MQMKRNDLLVCTERQGSTRKKMEITIDYNELAIAKRPTFVMQKFLAVYFKIVIVNLYFENCMNCDCLWEYFKKLIIKMSSHEIKKALNYKKAKSTF